MSDSKSGSKSDLNESNMPLLDEEKAPEGEKEAIEMKEEGAEEEKADKAEKEEGGKAKKAKKEKKKKEPKEKKPPGPNCIDTLSAGLDVHFRDTKAINTCIDVDFNDVLAEPTSAQGFEPIWRLTYVLFSQTKLWLYRIMSALMAVPAALLWALVFALITVVHVWFVAPFLKIFDFKVAVVKRILTGLLACTVEPVCSALGSLFSKINVSQNRKIVQEA